MNNFKEAEESVLSQRFYFEKLEQCSDDEIYQRRNKCAFYVGGVYISNDRSLQLIRLYQEGNSEIFDMFIQIKKEEVEILSFG